MKDGITFLFIWLLLMILFNLDDDIARSIGALGAEVVQGFHGES